MGKITDRFMNRFGSKDGDYDDFDEEGYEDELTEDEMDDFEADDDDPEVSSSRPSWFPGGRKKSSPVQEVEPRDAGQKSGGFNTFNRQPKQPAPHPASNSRMGGGNEVCIFKPNSIEDAREITDTLLDGKAVVINFEGLHVEISQRIIDFISGSCYALDGNLQKISNYIFIATPKSVDISGDFQDLLGGDETTQGVIGLKTPLIR